MKYLIATSMGGSKSTGNAVERVSLDHGTRLRRSPRLQLSEVDVIDDELTGLSTRERLLPRSFSLLIWFFHLNI